MQTSIAVSPFPGKFAPIPFIGDLSETLPVISEIGFDSIELHIRTPEDVHPHLLASLLEKYQLGISAFAPGRAYMVDGLSFINHQGSIREAAVDRINAFSQYASNFNADVFIGFVRGKFRMTQISDSKKCNG
jgi:5-keto-L-gluconate epimerase